MNMSQTIEIISAEIGEGAQDRGCKDGPACLLTRGLAQLLRQPARMVAVGPALRTADTPVAPGAAQQQAVAAFLPRLAAAVAAARQHDHFPLVLGGDHSCAIGTWSGIASAHREQGDIGLIWIDAHLDSHTPATSETLAPHGMPLAALLGHGPAALTDLGGWRGKLKPANVVVVGARSHEAGELVLLTSLGVRMISSDAVHARGMAACLDEALQIVNQRTLGYGVTFDVDALDPRVAPGVGSPVEGGLGLDDTLEGLARLAGDPRLLAFELAEYNPHLDDAGAATARVCEQVVLAALTQRQPVLVN